MGDVDVARVCVLGFSKAGRKVGKGGWVPDAGDRNRAIGKRDAHPLLLPSSSLSHALLDNLWPRAERNLSKQTTRLSTFLVMNMVAYDF